MNGDVSALIASSFFPKRRSAVFPSLSSGGRTRERTHRGAYHARIFFSNLIYRQFDGRKTRRHFCSTHRLSLPPSPLLPPSTLLLARAHEPAPSEPPPVASPTTPTWRGVKLLKFITPDIRRGVKTRSVLREQRGEGEGGERRCSRRWWRMRRWRRRRWRRCW